MGNEVGGRYQALGGMAPAQKRLEARHGAVGETHDRLVKNLDLAIVERLAQIGFQRDRIIAGLRLETWVIDKSARATARLGCDRASSALRSNRAGSCSSCATPTLEGAKMLRPS